MSTMLLNHIFLNKVRKRLENNGFSMEDFTIEQDVSISVENEDEEINVLVINYNYNDKYYFTSELNMTERKKQSLFGSNEEFDLGPDISIRYSPGSIRNTHIVPKVSLENFFDVIEEWIGHLSEEINSTPLGRQVSAHQEKLDEIEKIIEEKFDNDDTDIYFSKQEGKELKEKLDQLEKLLQESLQNQFNAEEELKGQQEKLNKEIQMLKVQVGFLNKKKWFLSLSTKFLNWSSRDPDMITQLNEQTVELFPQEIKHKLAPLPEKDVKKILETSDTI